MARLFWTKRSRRDLKAIRAFIANDSPRAADALIDRILRATERLRTFPFSGAVVPELNREEIREILCGNYRIIYRADAKRVEILIVYHAARLLDENALAD